MTMTSVSTPIPPIDESVPVTSLDAALLAACLAVWLAVYHRAVLSPAGAPDGFHASALVSNLHCVPLCLLAVLSLRRAIPESLPLCWSVSYFVADLLDTIVRGDAVMAAHAVISLSLNLLTGSRARHRALRSVSRGFFTEASTPFLNHWKQSKSYSSFLAFFVAFTLCRVIWVPYFVYNAYAIQLNGEIDFLIWPSALFYVLQLLWYSKMCTMVVNYKIPKELEEKLRKSKEQ